ncbi:MAG: DNA repair protein RadC [Roseburia sp.]|nr:DNA repair protein RadC [Roseburia sp.]
MNQKFTTVKELPDSEKPYEKFLRSGPGALSDAELLAVIIRSGTRGRKSVEVSQELLSRGSQNLLNLYEIPFEEMQKICGIGPVKAIQLKCIAELSKRIAQTRYRRKLTLNHPGSIAACYMERLRHERQEQLMVLFFDARCRLLADEVLSVGSATSTGVSVREIFLAALQHNAVQLVLLHNHPSGVPMPSAEDDAVTDKVAGGGRMLGIPLVDHIILGDHSYYSYTECKRILYRGENDDE